VHPKRKANPSQKCPRVKDKQLNEMVAAAWVAGWWCEKRAKTGHVMCYSTDAAKGKMVLVANTPSDHRTIPNTRSALRRAGLNL